MILRFFWKMEWRARATVHRIARRMGWVSVATYNQMNDEWRAQSEKLFAMWQSSRDLHRDAIVAYESLSTEHEDLTGDYNDLSDDFAALAKSGPFNFPVDEKLSRAFRDSVEHLLGRREQ